MHPTNELTHFMLRLHARVLATPEGAIQDLLIDAGRSLEAAVGLIEASTPPASAQVSTVGMTTIERRALAFMPELRANRECVILVTSQAVKGMSTVSAEYSARISLGNGVVGGGPGCHNKLEAAAQCLQMLADTPEARATIRGAQNTADLDALIKPYGKSVSYRGNGKGHCYIVKAV